MLPVFLALVSSVLLSPSMGGLPVPQAAMNRHSQGMFQGSNDIGHAQPGTSTFNPQADTYDLRGGGEDVWGTADDFRFTWTRVTGDASLAADVHIDAPVTYRLSKGMLMFRQSLDPGSPYADIAIHADGHITLQYRLTPGGETKDVTLPENNVPHLRIVRQGDTFTVYAHAGDGESHKGPSITIPMGRDLYVGLGVCSHNTDALQGVTFSQVHLLSHER